MNILLVEPFFEGSHAQWAKGFQANSQHRVELLTLAGRYWKWRMYGGAVTLAEAFLKLDFQPDVILATDMLDVATFQALTKKRTLHIPFVIYFHENQITYPWSPTDPDVRLQRDNQYGFINYTSALVSDSVVFNSHFHQQSFLDALPSFLGQFPDYKNLATIEKIVAKSHVLHLGMDLQRMRQPLVAASGAAIILWNHRWEYDKNPEAFFKALFRLQDNNIPFQLIVLGKAYPKMPAIFAQAKKRLQAHLLQFGYADSPEDYARWLHQADIALTTSRQDFFGGSVVEAMYCHCHPILPKRLAYTEHIPRNVHTCFFYETEAELYQKLKDAIADVEAIRSNKTYRSFVAHYDWKEIVETYDAFFEKLVSSSQSPIH